MDDHWQMSLATQLSNKLDMAANEFEACSTIHFDIDLIIILILFSVPIRFDRAISDEQ